MPTTVHTPSCQCVTCLSQQNQKLQTEVQELQARSTLLEEQVQQLGMVVSRLLTSATSWDLAAEQAGHWAEEHKSLEKSFDNIYGQRKKENPRRELLTSMNLHSHEGFDLVSALVSGYSVNGHRCVIGN